MGYQVYVKSLSFLLLMTLSNRESLAHGQSESVAQAGKIHVLLTTDLQDKYYRQALFHYFQDEPNKALSTMQQTKARLDHLDSRSALFEAGLQLSAGLLAQAKMTLVNFDALINAEVEKAQTDQLTSDELTAKNKKKLAKARELRLVALLSLTNQYLSKGDHEQAKETLSNVTWVSPTYYHEYHILNQLAYWPIKNSKLLPNPDKDSKQNSPYIQLNEALRLIELAKTDESKFDLAIEALITIKATQWHAVGANFWKTLFADDAIYSSQSNQKEVIAQQGQAIKDYAQLLLAQIYISQERYQLGFNELQTFPEQSPYTESALFLFAFASQQVKQFTMSSTLLNLLYQNYPYSSLGWQSAELMAQQVTDERSLAQGVTAFEKVEKYFVARQQSLAEFNRNFNQSDDLLVFSTTEKIQNKENTITLQNDNINVGKYLPQSIWLQNALLDAQLASQYQQLLSIDEQVAELHALRDKTVWISQIISLNQTRKKNIIAAQATRDKQGIFTQLTTERDRLAALLAKELSNKTNSAFANEQESDWLQRVERSHQALKFIGEQKNTAEYKQRLARIQGVLSWQLTQQFPQRSWSHTKQLQQLDKALASVTLQQQQIVKVSKSQATLAQSIERHKQSVQKVDTLLANFSVLRDKISLSIREKVNRYIDVQQGELAEHLLSTRQGLAKVLERMENQDKRMSSKLVPTAGVYVIPSTLQVLMLLNQDDGELDILVSAGARS